MLSNLVDEAYENDLPNFNRNVMAAKVNQLRIYGYEHKEFVMLMNGTDSYFNANMALLDINVRRSLFNKERPIYTKNRDDMPTRYGTKSDVKNSIIGDGCVINGTVKNSILFRGVKVEKGAVIENCILMQETKVGENAHLSNVISDKNAQIEDKKQLVGHGNAGHLRRADRANHDVVQHVYKVGNAVLYHYGQHKGENSAVEFFCTDELFYHGNTSFLKSCDYTINYKT